LHHFARVKDELNALTECIISAALEVHHELGPGLLESAYETCTAFELLSRGLSIERLERVHSVQLLSYLRFAECRVGLLLNVHAGALVRDGLRRVVSGFSE